MYCPQCGTENADDAVSCALCGADLGTYRQKWADAGSVADQAAPPADAAPSYDPATPAAAAPSYDPATPPAAAGDPAPSYIPAAQPAGAAATPPPGQPAATPPPYQPAGGPPPYQPVYQPPYQPQYQPHYQPGYQAPAQQTPGYQPGYSQPRTYPPYQPGYDPTRGQYYPPRIPSHLAWAIVTMLLCFLPTGIVAVVYATKVDNLLSMGNVMGAQEASRNAKIWCWVSFGIWVAWFLIVILLVIIGIAASVRSSGGSSF